MRNFLLKRANSLFDSEKKKQYNKENNSMNNEDNWEKDAIDKLGSKLSYSRMKYY
jgi:hypothetical protein